MYNHDIYAGKAVCSIDFAPDFFSAYNVHTSVKVTSCHLKHYNYFSPMKLSISEAFQLIFLLLVITVT